jgi:hypothetical protein
MAAAVARRRPAFGTFEEASMMKAIYAGVVLFAVGALGIGCAGQVDSTNTSGDDENVTAPVEKAPESLGTCFDSCKLDYQECLINDVAPFECAGDFSQCKQCCTHYHGTVDCG